MLATLGSYCVGVVAGKQIRALAVQGRVSAVVVACQGLMLVGFWNKSSLRIRGTYVVGWKKRWELFRWLTDSGLGS